MIRQFVVTAYIQDSQGRILLLWHKGLKGWLPPGGHIDENETPEDAAKRECKEETGLDVEIIGDESPDLFAGAPNEGRMLKRPFSLLLEEIPANDAKGQPAHQHMDMMYHARPLDEAQAIKIAEEEADHVRWFTKEEFLALPEDQMFKNLRAKVLLMFG